MKNVGAPVLLTIEGLGYTVIPMWAVEMFEKILEKADAERDATPTSPPPGEGGDGKNET